jgi:hypothetical protein
MTQKRKQLAAIFYKSMSTRRNLLAFAIQFNNFAVKTLDV